MGVKEGEGNKDLEKFHLNIYPNPANKYILVSAMVHRNSYVDCGVYDVAGKLVKTLFSGPIATEDFRLRWDLKDENGKKINSGVYFIRFRTDSTQNYAKLVIVE